MRHTKWIGESRPDDRSAWWLVVSGRDKSIDGDGIRARALFALSTRVVCVCVCVSPGSNMIFFRTEKIKHMPHEQRDKGSPSSDQLRRYFFFVIALRYAGVCPLSARLAAGLDSAGANRVYSITAGGELVCAAKLIGRPQAKVEAASAWPLADPQLERNLRSHEQVGSSQSGPSGRNAAPARSRQVRDNPCLEAALVPIRLFTSSRLCRHPCPGCMRQLGDMVRVQSLPAFSRRA